MKNTIKYILSVIIISFFGVLLIIKAVQATKKDIIKSATITVKPVTTEIIADGIVRSQNEASLHFATGGKVVYLPFKEGDHVNQGQTIASLDSYTIQKQLTAALNNYRVTRNNFDQLKDNIGDNVAKAQQTYPYDYYSRAGMSGTDKEDAINNAVRRILDNNQANLDNSVIQVELANYAFTLASLTSPIDGTLIHQDITTPNIIVTPQNTFTVVDTGALIFKANVSESDIPYVSEGAEAVIQLTGLKNKKISGIVTKIYPDKISLPTGESVYQVDIESNDLANIAKYKQDGIVLIENKYKTPVVLVPSWIILSDQYLWVEENNKPKLKTVKIGETINGKTEVVMGLNPNDKIILNPQSLINKNYFTL